MNGFCKGKGKKGCFRGCFKSYCRCQNAVSFGLGLVVSCFCPNGFILLLAAIIIVALGIALERRGPARA